MGTEAIIQIMRTGPTVDQQTIECLKFCQTQEWTVKRMFPPQAVDQLMRIAEAGDAELVVMAVVNAESLTIEARLAVAGVRVAYCRQTQDRVGLDTDTSGVIAFLHRRGKPVPAIASFLGILPERVLRVLRRRGVHLSPNEAPPRSTRRPGRSDTGL